MQESTPVNPSPFLICRGCGGTPTRHSFIEKKHYELPRPPKDGKPQSPEKFDDLMFACNDCKSVRQFGREQA